MRPQLRWPLKNRATSCSLAPNEDVTEARSSDMQSHSSEPYGTEPYRQTVEETLAALGADADLGLSQDEARSRPERCGRNELRAEEPVPAWRKFLAQFTDVLVILLLIAALISAGLWLYEREAACPCEAIAILAAVP